MREESLLAIYNLAKRDHRVVFIGSDLGPATLTQFQREFPDRFYMEGICEQAIIGMAAGLALAGYIPFVNTIGTFLTRRAFEQIAIDLCLQNLPVRLLGFGGGVVYAPLGPTHLAIEDMGILNTLPNMTICAPCDVPDVQRIIDSTQNLIGPMYIRLGRGDEPTVSADVNNFVIGEGLYLKRGDDVSLISCGSITHRVLDAATILESEGLSPSVVHFPCVKPIAIPFIEKLVQQTKNIVIVEEHVPIGGLGSAILELLCKTKLLSSCNIRHISLPDRFPEGYGTQEYLLDKYDLTPQTICNAAKDCLG